LDESVFIPLGAQTLPHDVLTVLSSVTGGSLSDSKAACASSW